MIQIHIKGENKLTHANGKKNKQNSHKIEIQFIKKDKNY